MTPPPRLRSGSTHALDRRRLGWKNNVVKPLQDKPETLYVLERSDAREHAEKRFPHKRTKIVQAGLRPSSIEGFARGAPLSFRRDHTKDMPVTVYQFRFTGREPASMTFTLGRGEIDVQSGLVGTPDVSIIADSDAWLGVLAKERSIAWSLLTRRVRVRGPMALFKRFADCFAR